MPRLADAQPHDTCSARRNSRAQGTLYPSRTPMSVVNSAKGPALSRGNRTRRAGARAGSPGALDRGAQRTSADRRSHRDHAFWVTAYADRQGKILGIDPEDLTVDAAPMVCGRNAPTRKPTWQHFPARPLYNTRAETAPTVATNKAPLGPYRGVGRPGACFAIRGGRRVAAANKDNTATDALNTIGAVRN